MTEPVEIAKCDGSSPKFPEELDLMPMQVEYQTHPVIGDEIRREGGERSNRSTVYSK